MEAPRRPRLLIDQNLSPRLVRRLSDLFPDSRHALEEGLDVADDREMQVFARTRNFAVLTKDADHVEMAHSGPPGAKVIWLRLGNCDTDEVEDLLRSKYEDIVAFLSIDGPTVLALP